MRPQFTFALWSLLGAGLFTAAQPVQIADERLLFDFEDAAGLKAWANLESPDAREPEPRVQIALAAEHATSGQHSLKLTCAGGRWPTVTTTQVLDDWMPQNPEQNPNMWVAEPCNRPWDEYEVNAYEFAKDKFWKAIGGMHWGDAPDFHPVYIAHGPGGGQVSVWDFKEAIKFWTDGEHSNNGFMLHCDAYDWFLRAHYRESRVIKNRPAVLVVYEPAL